MTNVVVNDWRLMIDAGGGEHDPAVGPVVDFVVDAFRLWGCPVRASDGRAEVELPLPGDPVREFVMVGLRAVAEKYPTLVDLTEVVGRG